MSLISMLLTLGSRLRGIPRRIYADHASGTPIESGVVRVVAEFLRAGLGNPSSIHEEGRAGREVLESARRGAARVLAVHPEEIIFTSGGTESNNLGILGVLRKHSSGKSLHALTSVIEHASVLEPLIAMERLGITRVTFLPVDGHGRISIKDLKSSLGEDTVLLSFALGNGEIGTLEAVREIAKVLRDFKISRGREAKEPPYLHTDASQAAAYLPLRPKDLGVDLLSLDSSKVYGPPGAGLLYVRRSLKLEPLFYGGGQEWGLRAGSENPPLAAGFALALAKAEKLRKSENERLRRLSQIFIKSLSEALPEVIFNSSLERGLPHIVNISIPGLNSEFASVSLDREGISVSSASACRSISLSGASYVVEALPGRGGLGKSSLRFSFGRQTRQADIYRIVRVLKRLVFQQLASVSSLEVSF